MGELSLIRKIIAFVLMLVALPVLFIGTCVPVGMISSGSQILAIPAFTVVFIAVAIGIAVRTSNPGIRWAIIVQLAIVGIAAAVWAIQLFLH